MDFLVSYLKSIRYDMTYLIWRVWCNAATDQGP